MARRKVTMLDAFKVSARESQERLLTERRRLAAEREKEVRRDEASRSASEWGRRLGEGVGSWWSQIWGADERLSTMDRLAAPSMTDLRGGPSTALGADDPGTPEAPVAQEGADGSHGGGAAAAGIPATPIDRRPARVSSWEAPESTASVLADGAPGGLVDSGGRVTSSAGMEGALPDAEALSALTATGGAVGSSLGEGPAGGPLGASAGSLSGSLASLPSASSADSPVGPPAGPFDLEEFSLPMSGRSFSVLLTVALATVFGLGILLGGGDPSGDEPTGSGGAPGATGPSRGGLDFAGAQPRRPDGAPVAASFHSGSGSSSGLAGAGAADPREAGARQASAEGAALVRESGPGAANSPAGTTPSGESAAGDGAVELSPAERAFLDPAMKYTVMAITYSRTAANTDLAWEAYDFLAAKGFPVIRPMPHGIRIFIFVGAEEARAALDDVLQDLQSLKVPPSNRTEFRSAFAVNIATYR